MVPPVLTARDLIEAWKGRLDAEGRRVAAGEQDQPVVAAAARLIQTIGNLHLYECELPAGVQLPVDLPVSIVPSDDLEPTEGLVLKHEGSRALVQVLDAMGPMLHRVTLVPDLGGLYETASGRLHAMLTRSDAYNLGLVERLVPLLQFAEQGGEAPQASSSVLSTVWLDDVALRRQKLAVLAMELIRANKRILLLSPDHVAADELAGTMARTMKAGGLSYKMWISRYEVALAPHAAGIPIQELGFEAQMHQFYAKARAEKASLRKKYERFRELTPILAYKGQKQKDLDEVRLLEWRLLTQLSELQGKMAAATTTLSEYEQLPLLRRLSMQAVGKNVESLKEYQLLYEKQIGDLMKELDVAKARIAELVPEAAVPRDMRPEFDELKEEITKLGGTKKIRELLAAEEDTNRQAFLQNRRLVIATPMRVASDPLFSRVRFDVLIADEAPQIPAAALLAAAGLARERIVVSGDPKEIATARRWAMAEPLASAMG